jgi:hypothetical protein
MQPVYVTLSSSGTSPWQLTNWNITPFQIGIAVATNGLSGTWNIDVTMDDPSGVYPAPGGLTVFASSEVTTGGGPSGQPLTGSSNSIGVINQPIAAWRVTNQSTGGTVVVTALQAGIG